MLTGSCRVVLAAGVLLLLPAAASGAVRHVAPGGLGAACTPAAPCAFFVGLNGAAPGDEVVVAPGDYGSSASPLTEDGVVTVANLDVHGVDGKPRPRIFVAGSYGLSVTQQSRVRHLQLEGASPTQQVVFGVSQTTEDVVVHNTSPKGTACGISGSVTLRNSVCRDTAPFPNAGQALVQNVGQDVDSTVRGTTAVSNAGLAVGNQVVNNHIAILRLVNVIARGGPFDVIQNAQSPATARLFTQRVNRRAGAITAINNGIMETTLDPADQSAAPIFVDAAAGDLRQRYDSPTVDAGIVDAANGLLAPPILRAPSILEPVARKAGASTDIGADELVTRPRATTQAAAADSETTATVSGAVNPNGVAATYHVEYGPTTAYGAQTPDSALPVGGDEVPVGVALSGLTRSTAFHARLVATNSKGTTNGPDVTVTTPPSPGSTGPTGSIDPETPVVVVPPVVGPPVPAVAPRLTSLAVTPRAVRAGRSAKLTLGLDVAATVQIVLQRTTAGRRSGATCATPTSRNRRAKDCTRVVAVRRLTRSLAAGAASIPLKAAFIGRRPGSYRLEVRAAVGTASVTRTVSLRVRR